MDPFQEVGGLDPPPVIIGSAPIVQEPMVESFKGIRRPGESPGLQFICTILSLRGSVRDSFGIMATSLWPFSGVSGALPG